MAPTAWDFRNKLTVILNTAEHSGKPYVDVESSNLHTEMGEIQTQIIECLFSMK